METDVAWNTVVFQPSVRYQVPRYSGWKLVHTHIVWLFCLSDTKYRDIADGNEMAFCPLSKTSPMSDTKYRDIADGNVVRLHLGDLLAFVRYQVPRYSGYKSIAEREIPSCKEIFSHDD